MRILFLIAGLAIAFCSYAWAADSDYVHAASGIRFPLRIEQRFQRSLVKESKKDPKRVEVSYLYPSGITVEVQVYPAPSDAKGPKVLDGGPSSDATWAFLKEFEALKAKCAGDNDSFRVVAQTRFQPAIHKQGPIGMKATLDGKVGEQAMDCDVLLCERNGFFVSFSVTYPKKEYIQYAWTYHDVASFIIWPPLQKDTASPPPR